MATQASQQQQLGYSGSQLEVSDEPVNKRSRHQSHFGLLDVPLLDAFQTETGEGANQADTISVSAALGRDSVSCAQHDQNLGFCFSRKPTKCLPSA